MPMPIPIPIPLPPRPTAKQNRPSYSRIRISVMYRLSYLSGYRFFFVSCFSFAFRNSHSSTGELSWICVLSTHTVLRIYLGNQRTETSSKMGTIAMNAQVLVCWLMVTRNPPSGRYVVVKFQSRLECRLDIFSINDTANFCVELRFINLLPIAYAETKLTVII